MKVEDFYNQNSEAIDELKADHQEGINDEDFQCILERVSEIPDLCGKPITSEELLDVFMEAIESYDDIDMEHMEKTGEEKHSKTIEESVLYAVGSVFNDDVMTESLKNIYGDAATKF